MKIKLLTLLLLSISLFSFAEDKNIDVSDWQNIKIKDLLAEPKGDDVVVYKKVKATEPELIMNIYYPNNVKPKEPLPAIVLFAGGGWNTTADRQFYLTSRILADLGMIAVFADYRTSSTMGKDDPTKCVEDGKSAVRYLRKNAKKFGINPDMIAAGGASAGGHVAAATAVLEKYDFSEEDLSISSKPQLLVLYNAVVDNSENGYGYERIKDIYSDISPLCHKDKFPPTIMFVGDKDKVCKYTMCQELNSYLNSKGIDSEVYVYKNQGHGFFNSWIHNNEYMDTLTKTVAFLKKHKYLK